MRRRLSSAVHRLAWVVAALSATVARKGHAQGSGEGAADVIFPIGARAVAMGQTGTALSLGSGAVWWNPALLARIPRDGSVDIASNAGALAADIAASTILPIRGVGGLGFSFRYFNEGVQTATDSAGQVSGSFSPTVLIIGGTFAAPFGERFSAGFTAKVIEVLFPCTGSCGFPSAPSTGAMDLGLQYIGTKDSLFTVGAAVRNVGFRLQILDTPQSDPLPERGDVGLALAPKFASWPKEARVRFAADVVAPFTRHADSPVSYRVGAEFSWLERFHARAGYVVDGPIGSTGSGATFGLGLTNGRVQFDFGQMADNTTFGTPTYLSFKFSF